MLMAIFPWSGDARMLRAPLTTVHDSKVMKLLDGEVFPFWEIAPLGFNGVNS